MSALTYAIVRKDLASFIPDPRSQSFLVAFLKALYDPNYVGKCADEFLFLPVKDRLRDIALQSIALLETSPEAPEWTIETEALTDGSGQGDYIISTLRGVSSVLEQSLTAHHVKEIEATLDEAVGLLETLQTDSAATAQKLADTAAGIDYENDPYFIELKNRANAGFIIAITSLSIGFILSILVICWQERRLRELESRANLFHQQAVEQKKKRRRATEVVPDVEG